MSRLLDYLTVRNTVTILEAVLPHLKPKEKQEVESELVKMKQWLNKASVVDRFQTNYQIHTDF